MWFIDQTTAGAKPLVKDLVTRKTRINEFVDYDLWEDELLG